MRKLDLSQREREVIEQAAQGATDKEISLRLGISQSTLKSYWIRIRQKTGASNRTEAVAHHLHENGEHATEESGGHLLSHELAKHLASLLGTDGYVTDEHGKVLAAITGNPNGHDKSVVGNPIASALEAERGAEFSLALRRAVKDGEERSVTATIRRHGQDLRPHRCLFSPYTLPDGRPGVLVAVRAEPKRG